MRAPLLGVLFLPLLTVSGRAPAQSVVPPFDAGYHVVDLGPVDGFAYYGGVAFVPGNPDLLVVTQYGSNDVRLVPLLRGAAGELVGSASSFVVAHVDGSDGGLAFGPTGVLFFTWYGDNRLGQILPGSGVANRLDDLAPLGVAQSVGGCAFVPAGLPGAGRFKLCSYADSVVYDVTLTPDGAGTFAPSIGVARQLQGGLEGLAYVPAGGGVLAGKLLAAEWSDGVVSAWSIDANGDPVSGTRQVVIAGIDGPGGGAVDPLTGDVLFTDNGGRLVVLRAGASVGGITSYGTPSPGASGTPQLSGSGVAHVGCTVTLHVHHAPHALGVLAYGIVAADVTLSGLRVLTTTDVIFASILDGSGDQSWPLALPPEPALGLHHFYFQAGYLDASTSMGLVASAGLDLLVN